MATAVKVFADTYLDSVLQLSGTRTMFDVDGVEWAAAAMATPANVESLIDHDRVRNRVRHRA